MMEEKSRIKKIGWGFGRCNQSCRHCYNSSTIDGPEYTFSQLCCIADKICPNISDINFGTGEFIFNPNTIDLVEYIKEKYPYVKFSLTSNGSSVVMMQPQKIKKFFNDIDISLDFPDRGRHNDFRQHNMAWKWAIESLGILKDLKIARSIVATITSQTTDDDLGGLLNIANEYGANLRLNWFRQVGRGTKNLRVKPSRAWDIIDFLSNKAIFLCLDSIFAGPLGVDSYPCPAGIASCRIHQDMEVSCYPFLKGKKWSGGNLIDLNTTIDSVFNSNVFRKIRNRKIPFCNNCNYWENCRGGCVTRSILHNGSINCPDDFCPFFSGLDQNSIRKIKIKKINNSNLIHDGYLCTTICVPL